MHLVNSPFCSPPKPSRSVQMVGKLDLHIPVLRSNLSSPSNVAAVRKSFPGPIITTKTSPLSKVSGIEFTNISPQQSLRPTKRTTPSPTSAKLELDAKQSEDLSLYSCTIATGRVPESTAGRNLKNISRK